MTTLKEVTHAIRAMTQKSNQIKHHEVSISYLYLINQFNLILKQNFLKKELNLTK
jgi:hypothetical protein